MGRKITINLQLGLYQKALYMICLSQPVSLKRRLQTADFTYVTRDRELVQHHDVYAPINVKPARGGGGEAGHGVEI